MKTIQYTDHNGNVFEADELLKCPFCNSLANLEFTGNRYSKRRKAEIKCSNKNCRATMTAATISRNMSWIALVVINAWNKRQNY